MELKEIWEQASDSVDKIFPVTRGMFGTAKAKHLCAQSFIAGCEFENSRSHWFDPEKELPPIDSEVSPLISGHNESIMVLAKTDCDQIEVAYYNFTTNKWSCEDRVISWAYIPN